MNKKLRFKVIDERKAIFYDKYTPELFFKNGDIVYFLKDNPYNNEVIYVGLFGEDWSNSRCCFNKSGLSEI